MRWDSKKKAGFGRRSEAVLRYGYAFLDKHLFMPEKWFTDEYEVRRKKCKVPEDLETKPQLAVEMFEGVQESEDLAFRYVLADSIYGNSPDFISWLKPPPLVVVP